MKEVFNNWEELLEATNDVNRPWYEKMAMGEEVLVYEDNEGNLLLSDEPVEDPEWIEVEL